MNLTAAPVPSAPCVDRKRHAWVPHPMRRFQSLRHFDDAPQLSNGYFGMFTIAYFPPLWFALMDARLVAAVHSDASRINFSPRRRAALMRRHGLDASPAVPSCEGA